MPRLATRKRLVGRLYQPASSITNLVGLYNGTTVDFAYNLFGLYSTNGGTSWSRMNAGGVCIPRNTASWNSANLVQPSIFWDGSKWVCYVAGHNGSAFSIGRYTNPNADLVANPTAWTASTNPILTGPPTYTNVNLPEAVKDGSITRLWYTGWPSGAGTVIGYSEVDSLGVLTGVGTVLNVGSSGDFDDEGLAVGACVKVGSEWRVYYAGQSGTTNPDYRTGYATTTDPDDAGAYTKHGVISAFSGQITLAGDGRTYRSNHLRSILQLPNGSWMGWGSCFHPTDASGDEVSFQSTSTDGLTWTAPTGPILALTSGGNNDNSAENPSIQAAVS